MTPCPQGAATRVRWSSALIPMKPLNWLATLALLTLCSSCASVAEVAPGGACAEAVPAGGTAPTLMQANERADALFRAKVLRPAAVQAPVKSAPAGYAAAQAAGAKGDGLADDTTALQAALDRDRRVWLQPGAVYRLTRRLDLRDGMALLSDGSATLLMAADGFDNAVPRRSEAGLYSARGVALGIRGADVQVQGLFIVKAWAEDRYVIAIDVHESARVTLAGLRLRGFSLAPGIVTVRSTDGLVLRDSLVHGSCTASLKVPDDVASFQITGLSVDDSRVNGRGSTAIEVLNNVISGLRMVPLTVRREQSDGINFAAIGSAQGSRVQDNFIEGVDEGIDIFGTGIRVIGNQVRASGLAVKLIHGAREVELVDNELHAGRQGAVGLYTANPPEERRQVRNILIKGNRIIAEGHPPLVLDRQGAWPPLAITLQDNEYRVADCSRPPLACPAAQCTVQGDRRVKIADASLCEAAAPRGRI